MPKIPKDYSRTVNYKIVCKDLTVNYVYNGHTTDFVKRKNQHKSDCNNINNKKYNYKVYETIRENGGWENWEMIELEKFNCNDGNEARKRERYWYELLHSNLNTNVPNRSQKEYDEENKDKIQKYKQEYRQENKDKFKEYYQENKELFQVYRQENKDKIQKYKQDNKDKIKESSQVYYQENKDKIKEYRKQKIECECGSIFRIGDKSKHLKTIKHLAYLEELNKEQT